MSSTISLLNTILWTGPYVHYQPLAINGQHPSIANANLVKQTMLGSPFAWPWNRVETDPITIVVGQQDYTAVLPNFGFIEKAWLTFTVGTSPNVIIEIKEIGVKTSLGRDSTLGRPEYISVLKDDGQGNITLRLMPAPEIACTLTVQYQSKSLPMRSLGSLWFPIPDELSYIVNYGFLALSMMVTGDARFPIFNDRFVSHLLGAQDGLDELQRNIFLGNWLDVMKQTSRAGLQSQQGTLSRAK